MRTALDTTTLKRFGLAAGIALAALAPALALAQDAAPAAAAAADATATAAAAAITATLIIGSLVERVKFSGILLFLVIWFTFSYLPVAHMVWYWQGPDAFTSKDVVDAQTALGGYIWQMGALDFAGGTVVHV